MKDVTSHRWTRPLQWSALTLCVFLLCGSVATAQPDGRDRGIGQFYHSRWTIKEGAPGQISALAQTRDGFLWLATASTLYSFDGVRFERFEPSNGAPLTTIQTLHAAPDGGLWIGFQHGGAARLKDGQVTHFGEAEGLARSQVVSFAVDTHGGTWALTMADGLFRLRDGRWHRVGDDRKQPGARGGTLLVDRDGTLWVAANETLVFLPKGGQAFRETGARVRWVGKLAQAPDGTIWAAELDGSVRPVVLPTGELHPSTERLEVVSSGMAFDREGSLWVSTLGDGLRRVSHPERPGLVAEPFTEKEGLSADYAWPLILDREGNIWVGTSGGLDRFRHSALVLAEFPRGAHDFALAAGEDGAIWAGTTNRPLMRLHGKQVEFASLGPPVHCAHRDSKGTVWLGAADGLWRIEHGRPVHVAAFPPGLDGPTVQAMSADAEGGLWVSISGAGLFRLKDGVWNSMSERLGTTAKDRVYSAATDAQGRVWLGYRGNMIVRVDSGEVRRFGTADGLDVGLVTALRGGRRVWAGGQFGLAHFDGQRFQPLLVAGGEPLRGVAGILELPDGGLWVHAVPGIFHLRAKEVARAVAEPGYRASSERFDFLDGLPARPTLLRPLPTAVQGTDGRLWFATSNGVVWLDPTRMFRNPLPPPVAIRAVRVDGQRLGTGPSRTLPERAMSLEIDYTALSLSIPERVRFRYRLEGVDATWQDVGTRREAYYTNLDPGRYRFQVIAANNDGVWNETGATLELVLPPAFFQTRWFRALGFAAVLAALWLLYLMRLRQVRAHTRGLLEERHQERERIARELHDTLLQGIHGLILRFQAEAEKIPEGEPARASMEKALDRADDLLVEGRDRVKGLRTPMEELGELSRAFERVGEELVQDHRPTGFHVVVEGKPTTLAPLVCDEVFRIGREALVNAFQHADARRIEVEISYGHDVLRLRVRDDGRGIDAEVLTAGGRPGHWGLAGMRERARKIGAQLDIWRRGDSGTEVDLRVPAATAYRGGPKRTWRSRLRRRLGGGR
ncbi:sensor histidine kinase [Pyxidicoccus trucidator]|uniref:sensor histidine kinase n=1 Tax=Pyxidicoccus trucidator TaxID=2709662 RepID=UPI0013DAAE6B|nr:sensor histidine kinase [Pyxidicoccus trucidator]